MKYKPFKKLRRRFLTLIEIMIVIALITLIGGVLLYNLRGSLDEGRAFKTEQAIERITNILELEVAKGKVAMLDFQDRSSWESVIRKSPLVRDAGELLKDGWGVPFDLDVDEGRVRVVSQSLLEHQNK